MVLMSLCRLGSFDCRDDILDDFGLLLKVLTAIKTAALAFDKLLYTVLNGFKNYMLISK